MSDMRQKYNTFAADNSYWPDFISFTCNPHLMFLCGTMDRKTTLWKILNEGITMCLEIKYYNISVRQHNLIIYL